MKQNVKECDNTNRILYLECQSGISGDMTVAALLDLGADEKKLRAALDSLQLEDAKIQISRVKKSGLDACDFAVLLDAEHENHDHDMVYLHGHTREQCHPCKQDDDRPHNREHSQHDHTCHHTHEHRGMAEITAIIEKGNLTAGAKSLALRIFDILADAEAKAHGVPKDQVLFHEVGAVDSIIDIVAAAVCLDDLAPSRVVISPLAEGTGTIRCQHGLLPIPVPAVANIVSAHGLALHATPIQGELVTPTGAAIAAAIEGEIKGYRERLPQDYQIEKIGLGAGKRDYEAAGILRAMWITPAQPQAVQDEGHIVKLEANLDDVTGEQLSYCMNRLFEAGARDVSFMPIYMKKNRPAYELHVICMPEDVSRMETIIFHDTTTIGIRRVAMERTIMDREVRRVDTPYGSAQVKVCRYGGLERIYPEYSSIEDLCKCSGLDFQKAYEIICECAK